MALYSPTAAIIIIVFIARKESETKSITLALAFDDGNRPQLHDLS
jgi:hypothetical protein